LKTAYIRIIVRKKINIQISVERFVENSVEKVENLSMDILTYEVLSVENCVETVELSTYKTR